MRALKKVVFARHAQKMLFASSRSSAGATATAVIYIQVCAAAPLWRHKMERRLRLFNGVAG